ncbi:hypothetical protein BTM277_11210 [Helicobacter pylori]
MKNHLPFDTFLKSLKTSNRTLDFFTDWQKCLKNKNEISIALNHLNFLLGKDTKELKNCIKTLFKEYPKAFNPPKQKSQISLVFGMNATNL